MKKLGLMIVAVIAFIATKNVYAMTEAELTAKVKATYDINGHALKVPEKYVNLYEDYVDQYELTSEDCQYIADQIDMLVAAAKKNGVTSVNQLDDKCAEELRTACANVSAHTGVKATLLSDGRVSVSKYNNPNEVFAIIGVNIATNTGSTALVYIAGIISLIGASLLVYKVKKA